MSFQIKMLIITPKNPLYKKIDYFTGICWVELEFKTLESCQLFFIIIMEGHIFFIFAVPLTIDLKLHVLLVYMY